MLEMDNRLIVAKDGGAEGSGCGYLRGIKRDPVALEHFCTLTVVADTQTFSVIKLQ